MTLTVKLICSFSSSENRYVASVHTMSADEIEGKS